MQTNVKTSVEGKKCKSKNMNCTLLSLIYCCTLVGEIKKPLSYLFTCALHWSLKLVHRCTAFFFFELARGALRFFFGGLCRGSHSDDVMNVDWLRPVLSQGDHEKRWFQDN